MVTNNNANSRSTKNKKRTEDSRSQRSGGWKYVIVFFGFAIAIFNFIYTPITSTTRSFEMTTKATVAIATTAALGKATLNNGIFNTSDDRNSNNHDGKVFTVFVYLPWQDLHSETMYSYIHELCNPSPEMGPIWHQLPRNTNNVEFYVGPDEYLSESLKQVYREFNETTCGPIFFGQPKMEPDLKVHTTTYPGDYDCSGKVTHNNVCDVINTTNHILICHEPHRDMPELEIMTNVYFLTPAHRNHIVPWHFPSSFVKRRIKPVKPVFLVQGSFDDRRRNYAPLLRALELYQNQSFTIRFMGSAKELPAEYDPYADKIEVIHKPDAQYYMLHMIDVYAILPLVDGNVFYGTYWGGQKLTSSILWGRGFGMKFVVYDKLAELFELGNDAYTYGSDSNQNTDFNFEAAFGNALKGYETYDIDDFAKHTERPKMLMFKKVPPEIRDTTTTAIVSTVPVEAVTEPVVATNTPGIEEEEEATAIQMEIPSWVSEHPLIKQQEIRQLQWAMKQKMSMSQEPNEDHQSVSTATTTAARVIRAEFDERILKIAETPENRELQKKARLLIDNKMAAIVQPGYNATDTKQDPIFDNVIVSVRLDPTFMKAGNGYGQSARALVGEQMLKNLNGSCIVYGAGIDYETTFETGIARDLGCAVHAFDCTMTNEDRLSEYLAHQKMFPNLAFHPWCIGEEPEISQDAMNVIGRYDMSKMKQSIFSFETVLARLQHEVVDLIKFDIEGFEWKLLDTVIKSEHLPKQLAFELHTRHANANYVPAHLVIDKGEEAVLRLFGQLWTLGYRVVSKEINSGDLRCAEFVLYRFYDGNNSSSSQ